MGSKIVYMGNTHVQLLILRAFFGIEFSKGNCGLGQWRTEK